MFSMFGSTNSQVSLLVTEGNTAPGFYAAYTAMQYGKFARVVAAVRDRSGELVKQLEQMGVEIRQYDPSHNDQALRDTFKGTDSLLLIPVHTCKPLPRDNRDFSYQHFQQQPHESHEKPHEDMVRQTRNILEAAEASGQVKRCLLWSLLGAGLISGGGKPAGGSQQHGEHHKPGHGDYKRIFQCYQEIEQSVRNSKISHEVIFRNGFCDQLFFSLSNVMQNRGLLPLTSKDGKFAPVNGKDIGYASAMLLASPQTFEKWHRQTLQLTGPSSYSGPKLTDLINKTLNTRIEFHEVSMEQMREILVKSAGDMMDPTECRIMLGWMELLHEHKLDVVTPELQDILGREPSEVEEFFEENPDAFRPHRSQAQKYALADAKKVGGAIHRAK